MIGREAEATARILQKYLRPSYAVRKRLIFATPIGSMLRGLYLENSGFEKSGFYLWMFVQPMYVAAEGPHFNFGRRIGGGSHVWTPQSGNWEEQLSAAIANEVVPVLDRVKAPLDLVKLAKEFRVTGDSIVQEIIAYSYARVGAADEAVEALKALESLYDVTSPQRAAKVDQLRRLREAIVADPRAVVEQLREQEWITIANLKLSEYYTSSICKG